jgi:hypothetical protein
MASETAFQNVPWSNISGIILHKRAQQTARFTSFWDAAADSLC